MKTQEIQPSETVQYIGFWQRCLASLADSVVLLMIIVPIWIGVSMLTGGENPISPLARMLGDWFLMMMVVLSFWAALHATPGKMLFKGIIVDQDTLQPVSLGRLVVRYLAYYASIIPAMLGFLWVAWDPRKQGFHDKIARTVVIRKPK